MDHRTIMQGVIVRIALSVFGFATLAMLLLAIYNDKGFFAVHAQGLKVKAIQKENEAIEEENKRLNDEIRALDNADPDAIEKRARENLNLVKPGDVILQLPVTEPAPAPAPPNNN